MNDLKPQQQKALAKIIALSRAHDLDIETIGAALSAAPATDKKQITGNFLSGLLGYLGGALIVSGLFILAGIIWEDITSLPRVILSLGSGLAAFYVAIYLRKDEQTTKAALPLWILSALLIPTGLFVALQEYAPGDDPILGGAIVFGITAALYGTAFAQYRDSSLLLLLLAFGLSFTGCLYEHLDINRPVMWLATAAPFALIGRKTAHHPQYRDIAFFPLIAAMIMLVSSLYYYLGNTEGEGLLAALVLALVIAAYKTDQREVIFVASLICILMIGKYFGYCYGLREEPFLRVTAAAAGIGLCAVGRWIQTHEESRMSGPAYFFGSMLVYTVFMSLWGGTALDIIFPALPAFGLYASLKLQSRALLLSSILALLSFIGYYTAEYFADVVGWPIALMMMGGILIALCRFALKMNARMKAG